MAGAISIPVQEIKNHPLSMVTKDKTDVSFETDIQGQHIAFEGSIKGDTIEGTFKQNGQSFPFELKKGKNIERTDQTEEKIGQFLSLKTDKGTLHAELEMPKGNGPYPVMVIIPGSGPTDRNGNSKELPGKNNSLKLLAQKLARHGIASIRYDKRGVAKNQSAAIPENELTFERFVKDAVAWVNQLGKDQRFSEVGIIGHSQGSLVGMLASQKANVSIFVSLEGAGSSIDQVMYDQLKGQLPDDLLKESKNILAKLKHGKHVDHVSKPLQSAFRPTVQSFLSSWMQYNPAEDIQKMDIPVLIVNGKRDIQVPVADAKVLHQANENAKLLLIPKMNHVLKEAPADRHGNIQTYSDPDLPLADRLMKGILVFLKNNVAD